MLNVTQDGLEQLRVYAARYIGHDPHVKVICGAILRSLRCDLSRCDDIGRAGYCSALIHTIDLMLIDRPNDDLSEIRRLAEWALSKGHMKINKTLEYMAILDKVPAINPN